jgi:hypothetical protein
MSREITEKLFPSLTNYTDEMYLGNEPEYIAYYWGTKHGEARTILRNGVHEIQNCKYTIKGYCIYIIGVTLEIVKNLVSAPPKRYKTLNGVLQSVAGSEIERDEVVRLLKTEKNCLLEELILNRVFDLSDEGVKDWYLFGEQLKKERKQACSKKK